MKIEEGTRDKAARDKGTTAAPANVLEEGLAIKLDFGRFQSADGQGVMPVVVQDVDSGEVLLVGHVSQPALEYALKNRVATFWSMSRNELWIKGATSGNTLELVEVRVNCEQNSLLYLVHRTRGGACHTKNAEGEFRSGCYYRRIKGDGLEMVKKDSPRMDTNERQ